MTSITPNGPEPRVIGLWDLRTESFTIGGMLDLAVSLQIQAIREGSAVGGVCFVMAPGTVLPGGISIPEPAGVTSLNPEDWANSAVVATMMNLDGTDECFVAESIPAVRKYAADRAGTVVLWPEPGPGDDPISHDYLATLHIQEFFREKGFIPRLSFGKDVIQRAASYLRENVGPGIPVIVHISTDPAQGGDVEPRLENWRHFFQSISESHPDVSFVIIGNDDVGADIRSLPNVVVTQTGGNDLPRDLALVHLGAAFMGTASGPAQMALLGEKPFLISKAADLHPEFMDAEHGGIGRVAFALEGQRLIRKELDAEDLINGFDDLYARASTGAPLAYQETDVNDTNEGNRD